MTKPEEKKPAETGKTAPKQVDLEALYESLADRIRAHNPNADLGRIRAAFEVADRAHSGQLRKDGTPYLTHVIAAADICAEMGLDEESIVSALLHDCIEDTGVTHEDIEKKFGSAIAEIVEGRVRCTVITVGCRTVGNDDQDFLGSGIISETRGIAFLAQSKTDTIHQISIILRGDIRHTVPVVIMIVTIKNNSSHAGTFR